MNINSPKIEQQVQLDIAANLEEFTKASVF